MVDPVRTGRIQEKEIQTDARLEMEQALRAGNIYEVMRKLPAGLTSRDFEDFMSEQWRTFKSQVIQDYEICGGEATVDAPNPADFPANDINAALDEGEGGEFFDGMTSTFGKGFKATTVGEGGEGSEEGPESLQEVAEGTLGEWENFTSEMWDQIFDAQMLKDYEDKMGKLMSEVNRLIAMAKAGQINPEFVLIALAKVNATKNGVLLTHLGKKAFVTNESMNSIANELATLSPSDPRYYSQLQTAQSKTRDGSYQLNLLTSDMQKIMSDIASVMEQVHGYISEINRTRREIITQVAAR